MENEEIISLMNDPRTQERGLRLLMDTYQTRLYWHIHRIVRDDDWAKDVLQEVFIKVYQNFHLFKGNSQLYTWIYKIASNEALQQINKSSKMKKADFDAGKYLENQISVSETRDAKEVQAILENAIQTLPEKQKLVFSLRYYEDLSYDEMSEILEMSVGTLKTNYHYAKEKIEQYILENCEEF